MITDGQHKDLTNSENSLRFNLEDKEGFLPPFDAEQTLILHSSSPQSDSPSHSLVSSVFSNTSACVIFFKKKNQYGEA